MTRSRRAGLAAVLTVASALLVSCSDSSVKGVGFDGGLQIVGFAPEPTDATLTVCFDSLPCSSAPALPGRADAPDFYAYSLPPEPTDAKDQWKPHTVHVTVTRQDGSVRLEGVAQVKTAAVRPARCYDEGLVLAVAFDSSGELKAAKPNLHFSCDGIEAPSK